MPSLPSTLQPRVISHKEVRERDAGMKRRQKEDYDRRHRMQPLPELSPDDPVLIKTDGEKGWKLPGEVVRKCAPRYGRKLQWLKNCISSSSKVHKIKHKLWDKLWSDSC